MDALPPPPSDEQPQPGAFGPAPTRRRRWMWVAFPLLAIVLVASVLILILRDPGPEAEVAAPTTPQSPSAEPLSAPENPTAKAKPFRVALTWTDDDATVGNDGYEIRRNGTWIGSVDAGVMRFVDEQAIPGKRLTYQIRTQSPEGDVSEPATIRVSTPVPPLSEARLAGTFDVRGDVTSSYHIDDYDHTSFGWRFTPSCDTRACAVRLHDEVNDITMSLKRKGGTYTASFSGRLLVCNGTPVTSTGTVELHVKKAKVIGHEWRATRLVGTMRHSEAQQLGCNASGATLALNGKLIRLA